MFSEKKNNNKTESLRAAISRSAEILQILSMSAIRQTTVLLLLKWRSLGTPEIALNRSLSHCRYLGVSSGNCLKPLSHLCARPQTDPFVEFASTTPTSTHLAPSTRIYLSDSRRRASRRVFVLAKNRAISVLHLSRAILGMMWTRFPARSSLSKARYWWKFYGLLWFWFLDSWNVDSAAARVLLIHLKPCWF